MNSIIIDNFFSKEEIDQLHDAINQELSTREHIEWVDEIHGKYTYVDTIVKIQEQLGRSTCSGIKLPKNIIEKDRLETGESDRAPYRGAVQDKIRPAGF